MKTAVAGFSERHDWRSEMPVWVVLWMDRNTAPDWRLRYVGCMPCTRASCIVRLGGMFYDFVRATRKLSSDLCDHDGARLLDTPDDTTVVERCEFCDTVIRTVCMHTRNTWNSEGTRLTCNACGVDGT